MAVVHVFKFTAVCAALHSSFSRTARSSGGQLFNFADFAPLSGVIVEVNVLVRETGGVAIEGISMSDFCGRTGLRVNRLFVVGANGVALTGAEVSDMLEVF